MDTPSKAQLWTGRVLSGLFILFMLSDSVMKLLQLPPVVEATTQLGYPAGLVVTIGLLGLVSNALYIIPRTSLLGAVLLTAYMGGAVATHVRVEAPLFNTVFPVIMAAFFWGGLVLRKPSLRVVLASA